MCAWERPPELLQQAVRPDVKVRIRVARALRWVKLADPATRVMSDFALERPFTVSEARTLEGALDDMFGLGVRALLVVREDTVTGLITAQDIQGSPPYPERSQRLVRQVMTPWDALTVLDWRAVRGLCVADVLCTFRPIVAGHLLVVEDGPDGLVTVRGLFSRTRIERQLRALDR